MTSKRAKIINIVYISLVILFFYLPILSLIIFSFNDGASLTRWTGFSMRWYKKLFESDKILDSVKVSISIALLATLISTVIGTLAAIAVARRKRKFRNAILFLNSIPIVNPEIVTAIGLLLFLTMFIEPSFNAMLIAHISFCVPYVFLTVYPKVRSLDPSLTEAAMDLGANPWKALRHAVLPQIKGSILAGAAIAFTMSFDDFVISYFTGGSYENISVYLYNLPRGANPSINALSTIIIIVITIVVVINYIKSSKQYKKENRTWKKYGFYY